MPALVFVAILVSVACNAMAHVFLRKAMIVLNASGGLDQPILVLTYKLATNPYLLIGLLLYPPSILIWLYVLSKIEVSVAYPFQSLGYILAAAVGVMFLGENVTVERAAGIALICSGLFFIARSA
jgi:multidrug transporter EmrE-like cation transporter